MDPHRDKNHMTFRSNFTEQQIVAIFNYLLIKQYGPASFFIYLMTLI